MLTLQGELSDIDSSKGGNDNSDINGSNTGGFGGSSSGFGGSTGSFAGPPSHGDGGHNVIGFEHFDNPSLVGFPQMPSVPRSNTALAYPPPQVVQLLSLASQK